MGLGCNFRFIFNFMLKASSRDFCEIFADLQMNAQFQNCVFNFRPISEIQLFRMIHPITFAEYLFKYVMTVIYL